jgi:hypothetical protein
VFGLLAMPMGVARADESRDDQLFRERIEPVLSAQCYECHSAKSDSPAGGLKLDSPSALERGGDSGPLIDRTNANQSLLIRAIRHEGGLEMPLDRPALSTETIADFVRWIEMGATDPRAEVAAVVADAWTDHTNDSGRHWAFQPIRRPVLPAVRNTTWARTPVDTVILSRLEDRGWQLELIGSVA